MKLINLLVLTSFCALLGCYGESSKDKKKRLLPVTAVASYGGTISPESVTVEPGSNAQFSLTVIDGYAVESVTGCGGTVSGMTYTTGKVDAACTVTAKFKWAMPESYIITSNNISQIGGIAPEAVSAQAGTAVQFTVEEFLGYEPFFKGCKGTYTSGIFTTIPLDEPCAVEVEYFSNLPDSHTVETILTNEGGTASPVLVAIQHGNRAQIAVTAYPGFMPEFQGCAGTFENGYFTTEELFTPCTLRVTFERQMPDGIIVRASSDVGGTIDPSLVYIPEGASAQFRVTPDRGKRVGRITGCPGTFLQNIFTTTAVYEPCELHVEYESTEINSHVVTVNTSAGGSVFPARATVQSGTSGQFEIQPAAGKAVSNVHGLGCTVTVDGNIITTSAITDDCVIDVSFDNAISITSMVAEGGSVIPASLDVIPNKLTEFFIAADAGWSIDSVTGCGGKLVGNTYQVRSASACSITPVFTRDLRYTIAATSYGGGSVTPRLSQVKAGEVMNLRIAPNPGYELKTIDGCDGARSGTNYQVVSSFDCEVHAIFEMILPPQNVVVRTNSQGGNSLIVTFSPVSNARSYNMYLSRTPNVTPYNYETSWVGAPTYGTITGLHQGQQYWVVVTAVFGTGSSAFEGQPSAIATGFVSNF